jgi:hypothetical protein
LFKVHISFVFLKRTIVQTFVYAKDYLSNRLEFNIKT